MGRRRQVSIDGKRTEKARDFQRYLQLHKGLDAKAKWMAAHIGCLNAEVDELKRQMGLLKARCTRLEKKGGDK